MRIASTKLSAMRSLVSRTLAWLQASPTLSTSANTLLRCSPDALSRPQVFGADIIDLSAHKVTNFSSAAAGAPETLWERTPGLDFCNVTVTYTHPGQNDVIHVTIWLPFDWNGRFQGVGGGGYVTGNPFLGQAVELGYAAASTDGGHSTEKSAASWALLSPGNVNWNLLQDFAYRALDDLAIIGKAITTSYYGTLPKYSYWNGCSTGGRQGLMFAQRFPHYFNGILANSPAINWATFLVSEFWPQQRMNQLGAYPLACELEAFTAAAIEACDGLDGVNDGIIGAPGLCHFDPHTVVGTSFECNGTKKQFTPAGAAIAQAAWTGPIGSDGRPVWFGLNKDASLLPLASTTVTGNGTRKGSPFYISEEWIRLFVAKNPALNTASLTDAEYLSVLKASRQQYESIISTNWPDLAEFRDAGGKMITWHGLADSLIFPNGTLNYYQQVLTKDQDAANFYRLFEAPGVGHCRGGNGPMPKDALGVLRKWVEYGVAPDTLEAVSAGADGTTTRNLCPHPLVQRYRGGDPKAASSFDCAADFV